MSTGADDTGLVQLVEWLEAAGQSGDPVAIFGRFIRGEPTSCRRTGYDHSRIAREGVAEVRFWFPLAELRKVCSIESTDELAQWLEAISIDGIEASLTPDKKLGTCVLVKRLHYVPVDERGAWTASDITASEDSA